MNRIINEFKSGYNEIRWIWLFSIYLLVTTAIAILLAYACDGRFAESPSISQIILVGLGGALSLYAALTHSKTGAGKKSNIYTPLSFGLMEVSRFIYSKQTFESVFIPMVGDFQQEYYEILYRKAEETSLILTRFILFLRYNFALLRVMIRKNPIGNLFYSIKQFIK